MIPESKRLQRLYTKQSNLVKETSNIYKQINNFMDNCNHKTIQLGAVSPILACKNCGKHFGWWCPKSRDNTCEYRTDEWCIHCGEPDERK